MTKYVLKFQLEIPHKLFGTFVKISSKSANYLGQNRKKTSSHLHCPSDERIGSWIREDTTATTRAQNICFLSIAPF